MSLVRMRKTMHDKLPLIMLGLALVFAVGWIGLCLGSGRSAFKVSDQSGAIAVVDGQGIDRQQFEAQVQRMIDQVGKERQTSAFEESQIRGNVLDSMISGMLRMQAAKKAGVRVSRGEIKKAINQYVDMQIAQLRSRFLAGSKDQSDAALDKALSRNGMSLSQLKDQLRASIDQNQVREQVTMQKLMTKLQDKVDSSDKAVRASFDEARFSQITISAASRSEAQAEQRAKQVSDKIKQGGDFTAVAKEYSEDPYKAKGGDRGGIFLRRAYMEKDLADKLFALKPGQVSDPIKMGNGYIIVKLDGIRNSLPADYATDPKKRKKYRDAYMQEQAYTIQSQFMIDAQKNAKIEVKDPEMKAYMATKAMSDPSQAKAKAEEAISNLRTAINTSTGDTQAMARIYAQLAYLYQWLSKPSMFASSKTDQAKYKAEEKKAIESALQYTESNDLRNMLADINIEEGQYAKALDNLQFVSDNAFDDPVTHKQLMAKYEKLQKYEPEKVATLIATEKKWLADYDKQQAAMKKQQSQQGSVTSTPIQVTPESRKAAGKAQGGG